MSCSFSCLGFPHPACPCCQQVDTCRDKDEVVPHSPWRHEGLSAPQPSSGKDILVEGSCYQPPPRAGPVSTVGAVSCHERMFGLGRDLSTAQGHGDLCTCAQGCPFPCRYMVDAADQEKIEASKNELHNLLDKPQLQGIPVSCCPAPAHSHSWS